MLNIRKFISISVQLGIQACEVIKDCYANKQLKKYQKAVDDPVTEADFKVQTFLISGLRTYFPNIQIIGQQTTQFEGKIDFNFKNLLVDILPPAIKMDYQLPLQQVCVYIDPIDSTKGFINGRLEQVTILIGLAHEKRAVVGVIGMPYQMQGQQRVYQPSIIFGSDRTKQAYQYILKNKQYIRLQKKSQHKGNIRICQSNSRNCEKIEKCIEYFKAENIKIGGSGKKIIMVAKGEAQMMCYLQPGNKKWDTCAPQAIINSLDGFLITQQNNCLEYDPKDKNVVNPGFICTMQQDLVKKCIDKGIIG